MYPLRRLISKRVIPGATNFVGKCRIIAADANQVTFLARQGARVGGEREQLPVTIETIEFVRRWCQHIQPEQLTKTRYFGGWCCHQRTKYQATCRRLLGLDINPNSNDAAGEEIELPALLGSLDDEPEEKKTGHQCAACGSHKLRFIGQTPKPSWSDLLTHEDVRCPEWYAVTEYAEFCNYLEREYGISYSD